MIYDSYRHAIHIQTLNKDRTNGNATTVGQHPIKHLR